MSMANFDTLEYVEELIRVGIEPLHAEAITKATAKAINQTISNEMASKNDLYELKTELMLAIHDSMWRMISLIAGIQSILLGAFGLIQYLSH